MPVKNIRPKSAMPITSSTSTGSAIASSTAADPGLAPDRLRIMRTNEFERCITARINVKQPDELVVHPACLLMS
jgi:hypothetical protein